MPELTKRKIEIEGASVVRIKLCAGTRLEIESVAEEVRGFRRRLVELEAEESEGGGMRVSYGIGD